MKQAPGRLIRLPKRPEAGLDQPDVRDSGRADARRLFRTGNESLEFVMRIEPRQPFIREHVTGGLEAFRMCESAYVQMYFVLAPISFVSERCAAR